jgi:hypothetical protein
MLLIDEINSGTNKQQYHIELLELVLGCLYLYTSTHTQHTHRTRSVISQSKQAIKQPLM